MNIFTRRISQKREAIENIENGVNYSKKSVKRKSLPAEIFTVKEKDEIFVVKYWGKGPCMAIRDTHDTAFNYTI